jgi:hypothetical protein
MGRVVIFTLRPLCPQGKSLLYPFILPSKARILTLIIFAKSNILIIKLFTMQFSPVSYFLILGSKYSPRHPILEHPQSVFFL